MKENIENDEVNYTGGDLDSIFDMIAETMQAIEDARVAVEEKNFAESRSRFSIFDMIAETMQAIEDARVAVEEKNFAESRSRLSRVDELLEASRNRVRILEEMNSED